MGRKTWITMAVVAAGALMAGGAAAHSYDSNTAGALIRYEEDKGRFSGQIGSPNPDCVKGRRVRLEKLSQNDLKVVGRGRTGEDGKWAIPQPEADGTYWVVVRKRVETSPGHDHRCRIGRTNTITVD